MNKRILLAISTILILTLGIVAFAVNQSNNPPKTSTDSCAMMKGMSAHADGGQAKTSSCDKDDCCCKNGSCPMKSSGEQSSANCCCSGGSCPLKDKNAQSASVDSKDTHVSNGENSCKKAAVSHHKES